MSFTHHKQNKTFLVTIFLLSLSVYLWTSSIFSGSLMIIRLTQIYAVASFAMLYLAMLAKPFCEIFPSFPLQKHYIQAQKSLITAACYLAFLHACFGFFGQLGGFTGLVFLSPRYLLATGLSALALVMLLFATIETIDTAHNYLRKIHWKQSDNILFLAGFLILIHALMLGTHFQALSDTIPQIFLFAFFFFLFLEAKRLDIFLEKRFLLSSFGPVTVVTLLAGSFVGFVLLFPSAQLTTISLNVHAQHILLAQQAQQTQLQLPNSTKIPGLSGDRTKRYSVSFYHDDSIEPHQDTTVRFTVFDAANGNKINYFQKIYEKTLHMIITDGSLTYFAHIHPEQTEDGFSITTQFPHEGLYHIYLDFQPFGAIEQQFAFTLPVGTNSSEDKVGTFSFEKTKTLGDYTVSMDYSPNIQAADVSLGKEQIAFTIRDRKTKKPITTLKPYLAAFGHLVLINTKTYDYIHVHPTNLTAPKPNQNGGPTIAFLPLGLYGPVKPGIYRVFAQFNPDNKLFTSDFVIKINK